MSTARIVSVKFTNYKTLGRFSLSLGPMNILTGPNNSGKSTILSAFRALTAGMRRANSRSAEFVAGPQRETWGHRLSEDSLSISTENVHTDYEDVDTTVTFRISNGNSLTLYFPRSGGCNLIPETTGRTPKTPSAFQGAFPIKIASIPVLGPVEQDEQVLRIETVQRDLATHRASRHFRNYWHHFPEGFEQFSSLLSSTWTGMQIEAPERRDRLSDSLLMFVKEHRIPREIYWAGFGFQIWCQLLTHISRAAGASLLLVDEPEIYLHPDVQRQLLGILRDVGPDILLATHSSEIISEADPSEILLIERNHPTGQRLRDVEGIQSALDQIGSIHNVTLTRLARNRKILFVEGVYDFNILRQFARRLGLDELASGTEITPIESEGFASWSKILSFAWGIEKTLKGRLRIAAVLDRDFFCDEEIEDIADRLKNSLSLVHIHKRKEMENYLLVPDVLNRALREAIADRNKRGNEPVSTEVDILAILDAATRPLRNDVQAQLLAKRSQFLKGHIDPATLARETIDAFDSKWSTMNTRLDIVPGKVVLANLRAYIQTHYSVSLSDNRIIRSFHKTDVPADLASLLNGLEAFRKEVSE